jgi:hypothetical protein
VGRGAIEEIDHELPAIIDGPAAALDVAAWSIVPVVML